MAAMSLGGAMGRIEELREKIRRQQEAREPDPALIRFTRCVNAVIAAKGAYVWYSFPWVQRTFEEARGVPEDGWDAWLVAKTEHLFLSTSVKPRWPEDVPGDWCFYDDKPLTFVGQMPAEEADRQLFVFTGVRHVETDDKRSSGLRRFYKMLVYGDDTSKSYVDGIISY